MDGLVKGRNFDLILRTRDRLASPLRQDIARLFAGALNELRMTGTVGFQAGDQGWVRVTPPPPAPRSGFLA
jgi:hypothetical protein